MVTIDHEDGERTAVPTDDFKKKIKITCTNISNPVVKLNRLTADEILMWTNGDEKCQSNKTNVKKRKSENGYMTRSKKQKLNDKKISPSKPDDETKPKTSASRTNAVVLPKRNNARRSKIRFPELAKRTPNALMPMIHKNELVWAYIKGFPAWPGVVEEVLAGRYSIHFFGDYTRATVTRRNIMNYYEGFEKFSSNFGNIKLHRAIEEAKYFLLGNDAADECWVCRITKMKEQFATSTGK